VEILDDPKVETRSEIPYVGIRAVTPFRGMLRARDELLAEVTDWASRSGVDATGYGFLRLHVVDMRGDMDIEVGLVTKRPTGFEGRICSGVFPAGRYATLAYRGVGTGANRALFQWAAAQQLDVDYRRVPAGDAFACRYEAYLTDPAIEPRKKQWRIELAFKLAD
jgi:effector-binding domain-containing protein